MPKIKLIHHSPIPETSRIVDFFVSYPPGMVINKVSQVPAGEEFEIHARAVVNNDTQAVWEVLFTATDGATIFQQKTVRIYGGTEEDTSDIELNEDPQGNPVNPVMPDRDIALRIKCWGNDTTGIGLPPTDQW